MTDSAENYTIVYKQGPNQSNLAKGDTLFYHSRQVAAFERMNDENL